MLPLAPAAAQVLIPFIAGQWSLHGRRSPTIECRVGLNPLHCGAVVASNARSPKGGGQGGKVLIPFIAGQWSLRAPTSPQGGGARSLNPLHCGAVVASDYGPPRTVYMEWSQSPSLRGSGRFSLPCSPRPSSHILVSIPFIAGQWSLPERRAARIGFLPRLNPLHCGAVVASLPPSLRVGRRAGESQSPSLRGSGRFALFFSGLFFVWSLNPLHCGAVVASRRRNGRSGPRPGLNPLHCGAVVASAGLVCPLPWSPLVSIPFIAGQWSLQLEALARNRADAEVSIPFIAGQWSLRRRRGPRISRAARCLNPLHCGAVVASFCSASSIWRRSMSQSPSLRGSGRFPVPPGTTPRSSTRLNPLHCGAVVASMAGRGARGAGARVSIPFIAGQWSLRGQRRKKWICSSCLNPLHCGAVVASAGGALPDCDGADVSIPFIAGQWSLRECVEVPPCCGRSQSPSLRGSGRFGLPPALSGWEPPRSQSPSLRGSGRFS